jgi:hypothetical protein
VLILASYHTHRSGGGGGGGAGGEEASAINFPLPPFGVRSSKVGLELGCGSKTCCFFKLVAVADLMGCNGLQWPAFCTGKVAGQMLPMGPQIFPITFPGNFALL